MDPRIRIKLKGRIQIRIRVKVKAGSGSRSAIICRWQLKCTGMENEPIWDLKLGSGSGPASKWWGIAIRNTAQKGWNNLEQVIVLLFRRDLQTARARGEVSRQLQAQCGLSQAPRRIGSSQGNICTLSIRQKTKNHRNKGQVIKKSIFWFSPQVTDPEGFIQCKKNASEKFSCLGTLNQNVQNPQRESVSRYRTTLAATFSWWIFFKKSYLYIAGRRPHIPFPPDLFLFVNLAASISFQW